jgi:hypothetical protein
MARSYGPSVRNHGGGGEVGHAREKWFNIMIVISLKRRNKQMVGAKNGA